MRKDMSESKADVLLRLAERCEREEPSWGLCCDIELAIVPGAIDRRSWDGSVAIGVGKRAYNPPAYTTSLDAAVTLVPEGWAWLVEWIGKPFTEGMARLWIPGSRTQGLRIETVMATAKTPALALCAAALRALASLEQGQ